MTTLDGSTSATAAAQRSWPALAWLARSGNGVMKQSLKTPNYTTSWKDLPIARAY